MAPARIRLKTRQSNMAYDQEYKRQYYLANREKIKAKIAAWRRRKMQDPEYAESRRAAVRAYWNQNGDALRERYREKRKAYGAQ